LTKQKITNVIFTAYFNELGCESFFLEMIGFYFLEFKSLSVGDLTATKLTFDVFTVAWKIICAVNFGVTLYF
jgi:hypothetical protein